LCGSFSVASLAKRRPQRSSVDPPVQFYTS
jgi:hypothetical protein